ncbi:MAG: hypothetical protein GY705_08330, partial [Bacteroidetes bacterium]|nr:hypothetical protein [Bacteroidota bacterium]
MSDSSFSGSESHIKASREKTGIVKQNENGLCVAQQTSKLCVDCKLVNCICKQNFKLEGFLPPADLSLAFLWAYNINACPINVKRFKSYLKGYPEHLFNEVVDIVASGVKIPSTKVADIKCAIPINQKSTIEYQPLVDEMLMKELKARRIAGPFQNVPPGLILSPLGAVPKKEIGKIRIIHNLSFPLNDSVNSHIPREDCAVEYELIDVCSSLVFSLGIGTLMAKADLTSAFRLLRVRLEDLRFLGFS